MHTPHFSVKRAVIILAVLGLALAAIFVATSPAPADDDGLGKTVITWTPESLTQTLLAGESATVPVSFTSAKTLKRVSVDVSPSLRPFVSVSPASFARISKGQAVTPNLAISAAPDALPQTVEGVIRLRQKSDGDDGKKGDDDEDNAKDDRDADDKKSKDKNVLAKSLVVKVRVVWQPFSNTEDGYSLQYPPDWELSPQSPGGEILYEPNAQEFLNTDEHYTPPTVSTRVLQNPTGLPITEFASSWRGGWYAGYTETESLTIGGKNALFFNGINFRVPPLAAFIDLGGNSVLLILGRTDEQTFRAMLETLSFE